MVKVSDHTKCISLHNECCIPRSILIDLNPKENHHYPLTLSLDTWNGPCNTLNNFFSRICVSN